MVYVLSQNGQPIMPTLKVVRLKFEKNKMSGAIPLALDGGMNGSE